MFADELSFREFMTRSYPAEAKRVGYEPAKVDISKRSGNPLKSVDYSWRSGAEDLQRLQKAPAGLTESGIAGTLVAVGVACAALQATFRSDVIEPPDARERFEQPATVLGRETR